MSWVCVSGSLTPDEEAWLSTGKRCVLPRIGSTLYLGAHCADGRPVTESWKYHEALRLGIPILWIHDAMGKEKGKEQEQEQGQAQGQEQGKKIASALWTEKYRPSTLSDVIGHTAEIKALRGWLTLWDKGSGVEKRGVLLTGPPGIGKTTIVHLLAKEYGYAVTEYNASDTRSVAALRGAFALGVRRLRREVIVMDEVDGLSERGGVAEVVTIIRKTSVPVFCIANERGGKLKPLATVCAEIRCSRPLRSTIAVGLERILHTEGITGIRREELEGMCERNGNDIRSVLNQVAFLRVGPAATSVSDKDASHRMEPFSVTQRLFTAKRMGWTEAEDLVFVDSHMIPLMVQEAYVHAGQDDMKSIADAADAISRGDGIVRRVYQTQDWGIVPHAVAATIEATKRVPGRAPFQVFPQVLGKMSKQRKHMRWMEDMGRRVGRGGMRGSTFRLDVAEGLHRVVIDRLLREGAPFRALIQDMDEIGLTRDDIMEALEEATLCKTEIPTKMRSAFTREWNKGHGEEICAIGKRGKVAFRSADGGGEGKGEEEGGEEEGREEEEEEKWEDID